VSLTASLYSSLSTLENAHVPSCILESFSVLLFTSPMTSQSGRSRQRLLLHLHEIITSPLAGDVKPEDISNISKLIGLLEKVACNNFLLSFKANSEEEARKMVIVKNEEEEAKQSEDRSKRRRRSDRRDSSSLATVETVAEDDCPKASDAQLPSMKVESAAIVATAVSSTATRLQPGGIAVEAQADDAAKSQEETSRKSCVLSLCIF
jgi:hypothetical protein